VVQGRVDTPLDDAGIARATWAAERIAARYVTSRDAAGSPLRIYSSPLRRAVQTAEQLAVLVGGSVIVDEAFTQRSYGAWEGLTWDEVRRDWPEQWAQRERGIDPDIPGWDGQEAVAARVLAGLERIWDDHSPAVVVTHGSPITLGLLAAIGEPASSLALGRVPHAACASVRKVESGAWHIEAFGIGAD
jgi:probable phosphoglycerate mutase